MHILYFSVFIRILYRGSVNIHNFVNNRYGHNFSVTENSPRVIVAFFFAMFLKRSKEDIKILQKLLLQFAYLNRLMRSFPPVDRLLNVQSVSKLGFAYGRNFPERKIVTEIRYSIS